MPLDEHRDGWLRCPVRATARATRVRVLFGLAQSSSPPSHISGRHTCTPSSARITCPNSTSTRGQPPSTFADASSHAVGRRDAPWWRRERHHTMRGERATAGAHTAALARLAAFFPAAYRLFRTMIAPVLIRALRVAAQAADAAASGSGATARRPVRITGLYSRHPRRPPCHQPPPPHLVFSAARAAPGH